jgi:hypothetical protein
LTFPSDFSEMRSTSIRLWLGIVKQIRVNPGYPESNGSVRRAGKSYAMNSARAPPEI